MPNALTPDRDRRRHEEWLLELTTLPTAAGREHHVVAWIDEWLARRDDLEAKRDRYGNIAIRRRGIVGSRRARPVVITAHLDHPAFVVRAIEDDDAGRLRLEFRGGIHPSYFERGRIRVVDDAGVEHPARILEHHGKGEMFDEVTATLDDPEVLESAEVGPGRIARWDLPEAFIEDGILHAPACDDLAGVVAALATLDRLRRLRSKEAREADVRVLLTRAEEVGFVGCMLAATNRALVPASARVIALETSRSFAESPIGGGPIIRVGDRLSIFHHGLAHLVTRIAEDLAAKEESFRWQRRLMAGGACEATAFQAFGLEAICLCLPLGRYHNMGDIDRVLAGTNRRRARVEPETIALEDFHGLVALLVAAGVELGGSEAGTRDGATAIRERLDGLLASRTFILTEPEAALPRGR